MAHARMQNPVMMVPGAMKAARALSASAQQSGVPQRTLWLMQLRASQINGCGFCVDMHAKELKNDGDSDERIFSVAAWRETPYFTEAERAALALTEAATRIADRPEAVPDDIWAEVTRHFDEAQRAGLIINIGVINFWNRINAITRTVAGSFHG